MKVYPRAKKVIIKNPIETMALPNTELLINEREKVKKRKRKRKSEMVKKRETNKKNEKKSIKNNVE